MKKIIFQIAAAALGMWLVTIFVPGVGIKLYSDSNFFGINLTAQWQLFILFGIVLGLLNFFVKPILDTITLPLRIITLGLFSFIVNMAIIWIIDLIFNELYIPLWMPLLYTTLIIWILNIVSSIFLKKK